jgi:outer membrane protein OmpA-like peptidoglycan-associated protein
METKKIIVIIVCCAALIGRSEAQGFSIELDGGLQGTQYQLPNGQNQLLPGGSLGLLYTFRLGSRWGLITGIMGSVYRTQASLPDGAVFTNYQVDDEGSAFQYSMKTQGYKETQQFFTAGVPLLLQYHTAGAGTQWYFNGGGKVLFPSSASINITAQQLSLSGYYPDYNLNISNLPQHGFGTINNWTASTTTELKPAAALSAATGLSFKLSRGTRLYTGLYAEYGLTDLKARSDSLPLVTYNSSGVNGIQASGVLNMQNAGQVKLLSFGLQVRLSFGAQKTAARPGERKKPSSTKEPSSPGAADVSDEDAKFTEQPVVFGVIGETVLPDIQKAHLDEVADILLQHPHLRISIEGHICNSGTETEDPDVAMARAKAVARYLRSKGIARSRMAVSALSQSDPVLPDNPAANFQKRRVVITLE